MKDRIFPQSDTGLPRTESFPVHLVHFYDDGAFPDRSIADFLLTGLQADESAVIIATSEHIGALRECLTTRGAALHALERSGRLTALDAHATLEQLRGEGLPDRARLLSILSPTLDLAAAAAPNGRWRMFGEMTTLLAEEGNIEGSIELERLWNELFSTRSFRLYCAYPIRQFAHESLAEPFSQMCGEHDEVIPVLTWLDKPERHGRWLAVLQQRARSLQVEINERKQTEEALRQTQRDYAALVDSIDGIVWEVDVQTFMFTFVSKKAERLLGYPIARWLTEPTFWRDHIHLEDQEWAMNFCVNATQDKRDHNFEYRMIAADGRTVWLQDIVNVIVENDEPVKLRGVMVDITERKQAEEELRKHREHLEEMVTERTAELAVAKNKAEEADRLKSVFLATMSHELRTPLNSIIGFTGIMLQGLVGPLNKEQKKQLNIVKNSAHHLLNLINEVLDLSKIEAGQMELHLESFDMRVLIDQTVQTLAPLAGKKKLKLMADVTPEVNRVISDPRRVEQILINLVNNAIKFTQKGEVRIECRVRDGWLLTSVADTGIGIQPEDLAKLFTTFRQLDGTLARKHEGTGLGLAICQKLADLLGGEIRVESTWGVGSNFILVLPLNK